MNWIYVPLVFAYIVNRFSHKVADTRCELYIFFSVFFSFIVDLLLICC